MCVCVSVCCSQGQLSDVYGRRAVLLLCWAGPAAAYCSVGISGSLLVLLLARIPCGEGAWPLQSKPCPFILVWFVRVYEWHRASVYRARLLLVCVQVRILVHGMLPGNMAHVLKYDKQVRPSATVASQLAVL